MRDVLRKLVTKLLRETADKIDANTCELTDEESTNYYLKYVKEGLMNLNIKKH